MRVRSLALLVAASVLAACAVMPSLAPSSSAPSPAPTGSSDGLSPPATPAPNGSAPSLLPLSSPGSSATFQPTALAFGDGSLGFLGGGVYRPDGTEVGVVMKTMDGGRHWQTVVVTDGPVGQLWVAGGQVWARTTCDGSTPSCTPRLLRRAAVGGSDFSTSISLGTMTFIDALDGWATAGSSPDPGTEPTVRTSDGGGSWTTAPSPCRGSPVGTLRAIAFRSASSGLAVCATTLGAGGEFRSVVRSTDGGTTWHVVASVAAPPVPPVGVMPHGGYARGIVLTHDGTAWLWGDRMVPLASVDGGATWEPLAIGDPAALLVNAAWPIDARHGFALLWDPDRQATLIEATADAGRTWAERASIPVSAIPVPG